MKNLKGGHQSGWIQEDPSAKGNLYQDDTLDKLKGIGKTTMKKLNECGIRFIIDLRKIEENEAEKISKESGISLKRVIDYIAMAKTSLTTNRPGAIDHRKAPNPYQSRYSNEWREKIETSTFLSPFVCITKMITHIVNSTKAAFQGTTHESTCLFYHDALSLMTAKRTRKWMSEKGYDKMWILPEQNLFQNDKLKAYRGRPAGNSPELCNLDSNLNEDVHKAVSLLVDNGNFLANDDPNKYTMSTPKEGTRTYVRVFDPENGIAPSSARIIHDTEGVLRAIPRIVEAEGCVVDDINNRAGRRRAMIGKTRSSRWGGARKRKQAPTDYGLGESALEQATRVGRRLKIEVSRELYRSDEMKRECSNQGKKGNLEASMKEIRADVAQRYLKKNKNPETKNI